MELEKLISHILTEYEIDQTPLRVARAVAANFIEFAKGKDLRRILDSKVDDVINDTGIDFQSGTDKEVLLFRSPVCQVSLSLQRGSASHLSTNTVAGLLFLLSKNPINHEKYKLPLDWDSSVFDQKVTLELVERNNWLPGTILEVDGSREVHWFDFSTTGLILKLFFSI